MTTLATINGEALAVDELTFWGNRLGDTVSLICSDERGAVELFEDHLPGGDRTGGIALHSPRDWGRFPHSGPCTIVPGGGTCWSDVSFLAYGRDFRDLIDAGDHAGVLRELAEWHAAHFGDAP